MSYYYSASTGYTKVKTNTKKYVAAVLAAIALTIAIAVPTFAAKPADPGCFGSRRADYASEFGKSGHEFPGVGYYASQRAELNGDLNRADRDGCGGNPSQGAPV